MATDRQLALFAVLTRWEIPAGRWSWRDGPKTVQVTVGAHCVDLAWPWWRQWVPWKSQNVKELARGDR